MGGGYPEIDYAQKFADRYDHPGYVAPEVILCWGKQPLESNADGLWGHAYIDLMKDYGTKVIIVDPRVTWLGTRAEIVLQVRPGTDTALAMAFLNIIISEDLYDHEFVEKWTYGFEELAERVKTMPAEKAAEICGLKAEDIYKAARLYGNAKPSALSWGLAVDQNPNGVQLGQCLCALMSITGFLDAPGGTTLGSIENFPNAAADPAEEAMRYGFMTEETWNKRIGVQEFPAVCTIIPTVHPDSMLDTLETDQPYRMRMAHVASSNPVGAAISSCPQRWHKALQKLDFVVVTDLFMTPTAMAVGDVFLPLASCLEHDAIVATHYGWNTAFYGAVNNVIEVGETKSESEIMVLIGKRLYPQFWNQFENGTDFDTWYGLRFGHSPEEIREKVTVMTEEPYYKYRDGLIRRDRQPGFDTQTGRVEYYANAYQAFGDDPLPYYNDPPYGPVSTPDLMEEFPFILTTGGRSFASFHSEHRQIESLRQFNKYPQLDMHPEDAKIAGVNDGEWVWIESPFGKCQEQVHVTPTIKRGVVHAQHGWWYPEQSGEEPNLFGNWKSNINVTMPHKVNGKLGFGDCFKNMICKIYPGEGIAEAE
jgi:anaerobic selenocysteine-containing dehydrogenase